MKTVITTVGTSILTNRDKRPWAGWRFGSDLPDKNSIMDWLKQAEPRRISAEIHTWYRLGILENAGDTQVILIHSQTRDGRFCAERLQEYAEYKKLKTQILQVNELSYTDSTTFNRGLSRLVRVLAETIRSARQQGEVLIAATGGFKSEIAVSNLIGTLLGTPVYYIYEQFEELIKIEPIPIALAPDCLRTGYGKALLQRLSQDDCVKYSDVESLLKADGKLELLIESSEIDGEEFVCLNMLGEFAAQLLEIPPIDWPSTCGILPQEKIKLEGTDHHRPKGWKNIVDKISQSQFTKLIRYDGTVGNNKGFHAAKDNSQDLYAVLNDGTYILPLRIETTAKTGEQRRLVLDHLRQKIRL